MMPARAVIRGNRDGRFSICLCEKGQRRVREGS